MSAPDCSAEKREYEQAQAEYDEARKRWEKACSSLKQQEDCIHIAYEALEEALIGTGVGVLEALTKPFLELAARLQIAQVAIAGFCIGFILGNMGMVALYRNMVDKREREMEAKKAKADAKKKAYTECKKSLIECKPCKQELKKDCLTLCRGCGGFFCSNCFDPEIQEWELATV